MTDPTPELTADAAHARLLTAHPGLREHRWAAPQRLPGGWFITFAAGYPMPLGEPSWLVLDDGRVGSVGTHDRLDDALAHLLQQPRP